MEASKHHPLNKNALQRLDNVGRCNNIISNRNECIYFMCQVCKLYFSRFVFSCISARYYTAD